MNRDPDKQALESGAREIIHRLETKLATAHRFLDSLNHNVMPTPTETRYAVPKDRFPPYRMGHAPQPKKQIYERKTDTV